MQKQNNNSLLPRTVGVIELRNIRNLAFLNLHTGKRVVRNYWILLAIPAKVRETVHQLATVCKKYKIDNTNNINQINTAPINIA